MSKVRDKTYFAKGSRQQIYQRPISQEDYEGSAVLVECLEPHTGFDYGPGIVVEVWMVRFPGETDAYRRTVTHLL